MRVRKTKNAQEDCVFTRRKRKLRDYAHNPSHETGMQVCSSEVGVAEQRKGEKNENVELGMLKGAGDFHSSIGIAMLFVSNVVNRFF